MPERPAWHFCRSDAAASAGAGAGVLRRSRSSDENESEIGDYCMIQLSCCTSLRFLSAKCATGSTADWLPRRAPERNVAGRCSATCGVARRRGRC